MHDNNCSCASGANILGLLTAWLVDCALGSALFLFSTSFFEWPSRVVELLRATTMLEMFHLFPGSDHLGAQFREEG